MIPNSLIFSVFQAIVDDRLELDYRSADFIRRGSWFQKRPGKPENEAELPLRPILSQ
jgi:hypothetical protein